MWNFAPITHDWGWRELLLPQALRGFAQQFAVAPTVTLTLGGLAPQRLRLASGLFNLMRNLGGAIGIAACGTLLNDRTNLHFARLAEHLNPAAVAEYAQQATGRFGAALGDTLAGQGLALRQLWSVVQREALTMSFSDTFVLICVGFVVAAVLVPLLPKPVAVSPVAATEAH